MALEKAISKLSKIQVMQGCKTNTIVDERDGLLKELADRAWAGARPHLWEQQDAGPLLLDHRPSPDPSAEKPQDDFSSMEVAKSSSTDCLRQTQ